jgi:hypothetical protein
VATRSVLIKPRPPDLGRLGRRVLGAAVPLDLAMGSRRRRGEWPRQVSRYLGKDSSAFREIWQTRPWAQCQREGTKGRGTRWDGPTATRIYCGEQSRDDQGNKQRNRGAGRLLTSRGNTRVPGQRQRHRDALGRRWRSSCCTTRTLVSVDRVDQRGWGKPRGVPGGW